MPSPWVAPELKRKGYPRTLRIALQRRSSDVGLGALARPGFSMPSVAGITVTPQTALTFTAFFAGIRVISEDVASLPLAVFRRTAGDGSQLLRDHPVTQRFAVSPDEETVAFNWRESWIAHAIGWGTGYAEIKWSRGGEVRGLKLLHPGTTTPRRLEDGRLYYEDTSGGPFGNQTRRLWPWQVLPLAGLGFNGLVGYNTTTLSREAIGLGKAAEQFGAAFFGNSAQPHGFLKHPGKLKPDAVTNLRNSINRRHQGSANAHQIMILEEGMDWVSTQIAPELAQFLATRQFQVIEIARILRLPPHKIGDYSNSHLANIEASNLDYLMTTLRPWCIRIEATADWKLLTESERAEGLYLRHDIRALLRASIRDRGDYYQKMFQFGMSADEIRAFEEMNPIGQVKGGSKRFRPANLVPLDQDDQAAAQAGRPNPPGDNNGGDGEGEP